MGWESKGRIGRREGEKERRGEGTHLAHRILSPLLTNQPPTKHASPLTHSSKGVFVPDEEVEEESDTKHHSRVETSLEPGSTLPVGALQSAVHVGSTVASN